MSLIRSGFYLTSFFGLGYAMMNFISLNQEKVGNELKTYIADESEENKKNKLFMDALKAAADNKKPLYLQKVKEIEKN